MSKEPFDKFHQRLTAENANISKQLSQCQNSISNLDFMLEEAINICSKLATVWSSGGIKVKEQLQKVVFPEGIVYDQKIGAFRTPKINSVFLEIALSARFLAQNEKGTNHASDDESFPVNGST
ncbi:hypothetical protein DCC81_19265 [Chitinophaga parva]|uniref:Uncharacterized protein n=1 Tax=Chitinophaga parva TaxID=2169414 RepID=A0A2T7BC21_9BACT|nr:hypothetical protein [Chitinophaga parva]PUZ22580.1 hypothetical protein DCC81_19265 [Chitinophaga parva]